MQGVLRITISQNETLYFLHQMYKFELIKGKEKFTCIINSSSLYTILHQKMLQNITMYILQNLIE